MFMNVHVLIITFNVVISGCCFVEDRTKLCRSASAARAALLFKFLICGDFTVGPAVEAVAHFYHFFFFSSMLMVLMYLRTNKYP